MRITRRSVLAAAGAGALVPPAEARSRLARVGGGGGLVPTGGNPFVTGVTPGTLITIGPNSSVLCGYQVTPAVDITVTALGRLALAGNSQAHTVSIFFGPPGSSQDQVTHASVSVNMTSATPGQFVYAAISGDVELFAGQSYYVMSTEGAGDTFYSNDAVTATTADAVLNDSAYFYPGLYITSGGGGVNHGFVGSNFKYTVGVPGNITRRDSQFATKPTNATLFQTRVTSPANTRIISGTVTFGAVQISGGGIPAGNFTYQWLVDGVPTGPTLTSSNHGMPWTVDTHTIPDGTHIIYPLVYDFDGGISVENYMPTATTFIVANSGFNNGSQTIPIANQRPLDQLSYKPDSISYTAGTYLPARTPRPIAYTPIPGAPSDGRYSGNPALLRDVTLWYGESWVGPRELEYFSNPEFVTTPSGGVYVYYIPGIADDSPTTPQAYLPVTFQNAPDGASYNSWISPFSTFVEDPANNGAWWAAEVNGRITKLVPNGTPQTIVGRKRNLSVLTYDPEYPGLAESDIDTKITNVGNFPAEFDNLGGANDLCFDPRDSTKLYVVSQVDHFVAKIDLVTLNLTLYAGTPGTSGYTGDGGSATSATFNEPSSIIMSDGTGNQGPIGTMYVMDLLNDAVRKITPSGTISTLCGGTVGPTPPSYADIIAPGPSYAVDSITWSSGPNTGVVVMHDATTTIKLGYSLNLSGATNTGIGASGDPNTSDLRPRYIVTAFTDSKHFTVGFDRTWNGSPTIGTIGGSPVFQVNSEDVFSSPTPVAFSAATLCYPNAIRFTSAGNVVTFENPTYAIRLINPGTNTISRVGLHNNTLQHIGNGWSWISADAAGMCGPVDDIITVSINDAVQGWRNSLDGVHSATTFDQGGGPITRSAPEAAVQGTHYPWAIQFSKFQGRILTTGIAGFNPIIYRITQISDPVVNAGSNTGIDTAKYNNGAFPVRYGTTSGFPVGVRPAFWCLRGQSGMGFIMNSAGNNTLDDLHATYATDSAMAAYIQAGMGGSVPRPELVGNELRDFIYYIRRGTYAGSYPTPVAPGADDMNNEVPMVLTASAVRNSSTQITVSWTTNIPSLGIVGVYTPGQRAIGGKPSIFSDLESEFGTSHSMPVQVLTGVSPIYYTIVLESAHGIFAHCIDQSVA